MLGNFSIIILLITLVYIVTKKLKITNPIPFALLMGLVCTLLLWVLD